MHSFRTLDLAKVFYIESKKMKLPYYLKNQLLRASLSVVLNLSEGNQRSTKKDQLRFMNISLTSLRECQTIIEIEKLNSIKQRADILGAHLFNLIKYYQSKI